MASYYIYATANGDCCVSAEMKVHTSEQIGNQQKKEKKRKEREGGCRICDILKINIKIDLQSTIRLGEWFTPSQCLFSVLT